jgi:DNA modification methylase
VTKVKVDDIKVGQRCREDFGDIQGLAVSIQRFGLLHPIVVDEDLNLLAGERRLRAYRYLGLKEIEITYKKDLDAAEKKELELEENLKRKDLNWPELVTANKTLFDIRVKLYGPRIKGHASDGYGRQDHALALGKSQGMVTMDLILAEALTKFPELAKEKTKTVAFNKYQRMKDDLMLKEWNKRGKVATDPNIIHGDSYTELKKMKDESVDFVVTDPPFGVDLDEKAKQDKAVKDAGYEDSHHKVFENLRLTIRELYRVMKMDSHMIIAFASSHYTELYQILTEAGFKVDPTPLIWNKISGSTPHSGKYFPYAYEPAFWCMKGRRELFSTACNMFTYKRVPDKYKKHPLERPQALMCSWIQSVSLPGEVGIDCYAGGGSFVEACISLGRKPIAIEKSEKHYLAILDRIEEIKERGKPIES